MHLAGSLSFSPPHSVLVFWVLFCSSCYDLAFWFVVFLCVCVFASGTWPVSSNILRYSAQILLTNCFSAGPNVLLSLFQVSVLDLAVLSVNLTDFKRAISLLLLPDLRGACRSYGSVQALQLCTLWFSWGRGVSTSCPHSPLWLASPLLVFGESATSIRIVVNIYKVRPPS